jgi:hypothetical protein
VLSGDFVVGQREIAAARPADHEPVAGDLDHAAGRLT